ncbi:MAG: phosphate ABC transporter ATP-binding protein PstB [Chloroflexota bacterium]
MVKKVGTYDFSDQSGPDGEDTNYTAGRTHDDYSHSKAIMDTEHFNFFYGDFQALTDVNVQIPEHHITAFIGPSGCGKSTLLRSLNRMQDRVPSVRMEGAIHLDGKNVLEMEDVVELRTRVGMIFQRANPFPMSIFDNVAYGMKLSSQEYSKSEMEDRVHEALKDAALWNDVGDNLDKSGIALSGGQQQRLCIARAIVVEPDVLLMDEPCAALDPISTLAIEDTMLELKERYTIVIVTHNIQQAARVSDQTVFMLMDPETRSGYVHEYGTTIEMFTSPQTQETNDYITGRFG